MPVVDAMGSEQCPVRKITCCRAIVLAKLSFTCRVTDFCRFSVFYTVFKY